MITKTPFSIDRVRRLVQKELRQMLRDPRSRRMLFVGPVFQLLIFGYAVNTDVRHASTILVDEDRSAASRQLVDVLTATGYFDVTRRGERPADIANALDHGTALVGVDVPRGFARDLASGTPAEVQLLVDGSTANTANVALGYGTQIISRYALDKSAAMLASGANGPAHGIDFRVRAWYNPNLESRVYNVPAVMGNLVMMMSLLLTALAVVREREMGTLEQLMVTPLRPSELMLGKTVPGALVALVDMVLITAMALWWFDVPFRGSFVLLGFASVLFILTGLGVGLLISTVSATQQEAFMSMFLFFLPAMMLSGMMFPIENMPQGLQYLTLLNPIRHYLIIVRGVFLRGAGWRVLAPQMFALAVIGGSVLLFATSRFRKSAA